MDERRTEKNEKKEKKERRKEGKRRNEDVRNGREIDSKIECTERMSRRIYTHLHTKHLIKCIHTEITY